MKKSTSTRDYVAEVMGQNPSKLPPETDAPPPSIVVPYAEKLALYGEVKSIDEHGEEFINLYSELYAVDRTSAVALSADKPRDSVLPGLRLGQVGFLVSTGGVGKSFWALQAAYSIATGVDLCDFEGMGHPLKQGRCLYLSFEDDRQDIDSRIRKIFKQFEGLHNNKALHALNRNQTVPLSHGRIDLIDPHSLENYVENMMDGCRLIVIDTLRQAHTGDENDNAEMSALVGSLHNFARKHNVAVLVLHHTSKGATLNGHADTAQAARGASALTDNIRVSFYMMKMTEEQAKNLYNPKQAGQPLDRTKYVAWGTSKVNNTGDISAFWYEKHQGVLVPVKLMATSQKPKAKTKKADLLDAKILGETTL